MPLEGRHHHHHCISLCASNSKSTDTVRSCTDIGPHPTPRSRGLVDFLRVAGTISDGRFRYSRRKSMPESVRNLQAAVSNRQ